MCELRGRSLYTTTQPDKPSAMCLKELYEQGGTREQIEDALRIMPFVGFVRLNRTALGSFSPQHPAMVRGVSALKARGKTTFFCLSNANIIYITTILKVS